MRATYQVFISFKNSDDQTGEETPDKKVAYKVYKYLSSRGLNIFFSPVTLKVLGRDSWEDEIHLALKESKVFIAIGTNKKNMNSYWVHKERISFSGIKLADSSRAIYGYIASPMSLQDLPDDLKKIEVFQDKKPDALASIYTYIHNHLMQINLKRLRKKKKLYKDYLLIGILFIVGIFFLKVYNNENIIEVKKKNKEALSKDRIVHIQIKGKINEEMINNFRKVLKDSQFKTFGVEKLNFDFHNSIKYFRNNDLEDASLLMYVTKKYFRQHGYPYLELKLVLAQSSKENTPLEVWINFK